MGFKEELLKANSQHALGTYAQEIVLSKGEGCYVWDIDDKRYLDFTAGIAVCNLGHCHPAVTKSLQTQVGKLMHVSNIYFNETQPMLAKKLAEVSFGGRVFFSNSGAEANEGMIKLARRWGSARGRHEIICIDNAFHGRTLATLAATGKEKYMKGFAPDMTGFKHVAINDIDAVKAAFDEKTVAVMLEPIQGEGGIIAMDQEFLTAVRQFCNKKEILLLLDEVQCGVGRTGNWFAYQNYGIEPDAMSVAKGLGNGFPVGAFIVQQKLKDVLTVGDHGTTFGGNPMACAAGLAVLETIEKENILENCLEIADYLQQKLGALIDKYPKIKEVRGVGLMIGIELDRPVKEVVSGCLKNGLLVLSAGPNILRLLPPLVVNKEQVDRAVDIIDMALQPVMEV